MGQGTQEKTLATGVGTTIAKVYHRLPIQKKRKERPRLRFPVVFRTGIFALYTGRQRISREIISLVTKGRTG